jgi:hypothetical protein
MQWFTVSADIGCQPNKRRFFDAHFQERQSIHVVGLML